jgi:hypothetical protein
MVLAPDKPEFADTSVWREADVWPEALAVDMAAPFATS